MNKIYVNFRRAAVRRLERVDDDVVRFVAGRWRPSSRVGAVSRVLGHGRGAANDLR